jgi:ribosomal protein S18 acetylase RimI-like enzyme
LFCDITDKLDDIIVRNILALSVFNPTPEVMNQKINRFKGHDSRFLYGWIENNEILGVCGFEVHMNYVEILNIAVSEHIQRNGIGRKMIQGIWTKYKIPIQAETDDDAVDFYRKRGFTATPIRKYYVRRWTCILTDM